MDKKDQAIDLSEKYAESNPFGRITYTNDYCFLCGKNLLDNYTEEHVVPKWLLNRHNLWDQNLQLLNETDIEYRKIKIPCCSECNNEHLSKLESQIRSAVEAGYEACLELDQSLIFMWISKIWYGLLRKEVSLQKDLRCPEKGKIFAENELKNLQHLHALMQSIRQPLIYLMDKPFTVLIANLHYLGEGDSYFFRDNLFSQTVLLRTNEIGFIIALQDGEMIRHTWGKYLKQVGGQKLHPIQFDELYAKVTFYCYLQNRDAEYSKRGVTEPNSLNTIDDADGEEFCEYLKTVLSRWGNIGPISPSPGYVRTWMYDDNDNPIFLDERMRLLDNKPSEIKPILGTTNVPKSAIDN